MKLRALGMWTNLLLSSVLMLAVWVLLVWVGSRPALKTLIDMSPQQRATIDPVTVDLLKDLPRQSIAVEFHLFFEPKGPEPQDAFQLQHVRIMARLRELTEMLLRQYAFHGGESVTVENYDQLGDIARHREAAQRFGVTQGDVVVVAVRQSGRPPRHRTLSLEGDLGVVEVPEMRQQPGVLPTPQVPVLKDFKGEEALSTALKSLLVQGTPTVYFFSGNSGNTVQMTSDLPDGYAQLTRLLDAMGCQWRELDLRTGVPKDASVVVVPEPQRPFTEGQVRVLHDYVAHGGRLVLNYSWSGNSDWNPDAGELGKLYGFDVGKRPVYHLIPDAHTPDSTRGLDGNPGVGKLDLLMNQNHPITLRLAHGMQNLQFDSARELQLTDPAPAGVRREPLLWTGDWGWLATRDSGGFPSYTAPRAQSEFRRRMLGAAFEVDGTPAADGKKQDGIIVVFTGVFCNNGDIRINADLAANVFNWLTERRVLLDIRGSSYVARYLKLQQQQFDRVFWFLVLVVPGAFLCGGLFVLWRRRSS